MIRILLAYFLLVSTISTAQNEMIIYLKDKGDKTFKETNIFSQKSIERREKNRVKLTDSDFPMNREYLIALREKGTIKTTSKWLNALSFSTHYSVDELKDEYDFIDHITLIKKTKTTQPNKFDIELSSQERSFDYGIADTQALQINVDCLHDAGYTGSGIYLAVIDGGFRGMDYGDHFDSLFSENKILDTYDFVGNDTFVYEHSSHGTSVASCIAGHHANGIPFTGTGRDVNLALYVSEDILSETPIEELNLVAALERCDSVGIDIANLSLGYSTFDDTTQSYTYADMDGQTTISSMGCRMAAERGIVVVSSAGNTGPNKITTPCDTDSILCVGAIEGFGNYAWFSGVGPSSDGRVKPDVVARGGQTAFVTEVGVITNGNGTSFSSPVTAGAVACLMQANPSLTSQEIIQAVRESASQYNQPDSLLGYGVPDFCALNVALNEHSFGKWSMHPNPSVDHVQLSLENPSQFDRMELFDVSGKQVISQRIQSNQNAIIVSTANWDNGMYTLRLYTQSGAVLSDKLIVQH